MYSEVKRFTTGKSLLATACISLIVSGQSITANASEMTPIADPTWSGFYVGVGGGAAWADLDLDLGYKGKKSKKISKCWPKYLYTTQYVSSKIATKDPMYNCRTIYRDSDRFRNYESYDEDSIWGFATLQLEYKHQFKDKYVVSLFADVDKYFGSDETFSDFSYRGNRKFGKYMSLDGSVDLDFSGTVGITAGKLINPDTLVYGLVGYTYLKLDVDAALTGGDYYYSYKTKGYNFAEHYNANLDMPDELHGLTLGAGLQRRISPTMSFKIEYRYTDLEDDSASGKFSSYKASQKNCFGYKKCVKEYKMHGKSKSFLEGDLHSVRAALVFKLHRQEEPVQPYK